jgi:hypothetical protein
MAQTPPYPTAPVNSHVRPLMHPHTTKNDLYAELVCLGRDKGYFVIPEFRVEVSPLAIGGPKRTKNIDLVWARRLTETRQTGRWQLHWQLAATFEIEACDVRNIPNKEFNRHIRDLPTIVNEDPKAKIHHFIALYTAAYDRNWKHSRPFLNEIRDRQEWASGKGVAVLDGRNLSPLGGI